MTHNNYFEINHGHIIIYYDDFAFTRNPRVPCRSGVISRMDLTKWADTTLDTAEPHIRIVSKYYNLL